MTRSEKQAPDARGILPAPQAVLRNLDRIQPETMGDPRHGGAVWRMLFSSDRTATGAITCGVAEVAPEQPLTLHRHEHPEVYFGLEGDARATVSGEEHLVSPGRALFIPGGALHGLEAVGARARVLFIFAADSFEEIDYVFPEDDRVSK